MSLMMEMFLLIFEKSRILYLETGEMGVVQSQLPHSSTQPDGLYWPLWKPGRHIVHWHKCRQNIVHIKLKLKRILHINASSWISE